MNGPSTIINLTPERRSELEEQIRQTKERKVADRMRVILYKAAGHSHKFIANLLQMGRNQVTHLLHQYNQGGLPALLQPHRAGGSTAKLTIEQQQALKVE